MSDLDEFRLGQLIEDDEKITLWNFLKKFVVLSNFSPFANLAIEKPVIQIFKKIIVLWLGASNLINGYNMVSSIASSFKLKMTFVLIKSTILIDKQMVGGTVFYKHNF